MSQANQRRPLQKAAISVALCPFVCLSVQYLQFARNQKAADFSSHLLQPALCYTEGCGHLAVYLIFLTVTV